MGSFPLRPAVETDAPKIRDLIRRVEINPMGLDWRRFVVAETDYGEFAGCGQIKSHKDGSFELASIAVDLPYRSQGVARAIIEYLLARSPRPLYLMCRSELKPFYVIFGFRAICYHEMPSYFRRIYTFIRLLSKRGKQHGPLIMRLDR